MENRQGKDRSRSDYKHEAKRRRHHSRSSSPPHKQHQRDAPPSLPLGARRLSRHDFKSYRPIFAVYLDIQKQLDLEDLEENEVKGRWKSFVNKWNHGDLAEGWYAPQTLEKALNAASTTNHEPQTRADSDSDDDFGPAPPSDHQPQNQASSSGRRPGPSIPTTSDIQANREQAAESAALAHQQDRDNLRHERRVDRKFQKSRLDELTPRAEAGSKARLLENKALTAASNRSFAASAHDNAQVDVPDADVMGGEDSLGELKRMKKEQERKRSEREIKREEIMRARREEREVKLGALREKEEKTMGMLREIARQRFGDGS